MAERLGPRQREVLALLARRGPEESLLTASEIDQKLGHWGPGSPAGRALGRLKLAGMVRKLGVAFGGGGTWQITDHGRAALTKEGTDGDYQTCQWPTGTAFVGPRICGKPTKAELIATERIWSLQPGDRIAVCGIHRRKGLGSAWSFEEVTDDV